MKYLKVWAICHGDWPGVYTPVIGEGMNEGLYDSAAVILKWLFEMSSQTSSKEGNIPWFCFLSYRISYPC